MKELSRLMYVSTSNLFSDEILKKILEQSSINNLKQDITGVLCAGGGQFVQVLEGKEIDLIRLYSKIIEDPRHFECAIIGIAPINERMFDKWSMGIVEKSGEDVALRRLQLLDYRLHKHQGDVMMSALKAFLSKLK